MPLSSIRFPFCLALALLSQPARADWVAADGSELPEEKKDERKEENDDEIETPEQRKIREEGRVATRVGVGLGANFLTVTDRGGAGGTLLLNRPLWYGERHRGFQWLWQSVATVGMGTGKATMVQATLGADFGFNVYMGRFVGFETHTGFALAGFTGESTGLGLGLRGSFAPVFRLSADDRQRLKLEAFALMGGPFTETKPVESDFALQLITAGLGVVYETPY